MDLRCGKVNFPAFFIWFQCLFLTTFVLIPLIMLEYPPKILMAFGETFSDEGENFYKWLLENGYPELAALSSGIKGSKEAIDWLLKNKYPQLAALDGAIDKQAGAYAWLRKFNFNFLTVFADAINEKQEAIQWLKDNELDMFVYLSAKINSYRNNQSFDYHKLHF